MKRYISTLLVSTALFISARIIVTGKRSQRYYDSVTIRVGNSVVQISRLPAVGLHRTFRLTLTALVLLPYYIGHAAHLNPDKERLLDFLRKASFLRKVKTSITRLNKKSILSLMDESITSTGLVLDQPPPYRDWETDRKSTRLNSSHITRSRMPSSA